MKNERKATLATVMFPTVIQSSCRLIVDSHAVWLPSAINIRFRPRSLRSTQLIMKSSSQVRFTLAYLIDQISYLTQSRQLPIRWTRVYSQNNSDSAGLMVHPSTSTRNLIVSWATFDRTLVDLIDRRPLLGLPSPVIWVTEWMQRGEGTFPGRW